MGKIKTVTAIATQGNSVRLNEARLREYYIQYSNDGSNWVDYTHEGQRKASSDVNVPSTILEIYHHMITDLCPEMHIDRCKLNLMIYPV